MAACFGPPAAADDAKIRVVIIDGQNNHNWKQTTPDLKKTLQQWMHAKDQLMHNLRGPAEGVKVPATAQRSTAWAATGKVTGALPENFPSTDKPSRLPAEKK